MSDIRPDSDHYPTPPEAVRALLSVEAFPGGIWEPCAGTGDMAEVLREAGHTVRATTIEDVKNDPKRPKRRVVGGVDFLAKTETKHPNIITNPPYGKLYGEKDRFAAEKMIRHAFGIGATKIAMLMNRKFYGSVGRARGLWVDCPLARIWEFADRLTMYPADYDGKKGTSTETYAWFVLEYPFQKVIPPCGLLIAGDFKIADRGNSHGAATAPKQAVMRESVNPSPASVCVSTDGYSGNHGTSQTSIMEGKTL